MKNKNLGQSFKWVIMLIMIGLVSGCISIPKPMPDLTNPNRTIAILPFANESNNIDATKQIRELLTKKLNAKFYHVVAIEEVDRILLDDLGITLGEQLSEVEFNEIKSKVKADAYIFGNITHYDQTMSGVINTNRVRAVLKMVQARDEAVFWSSDLGIKSESTGGGLGGLASLASAISDNSGEDPIRWITIESEKGGDGSLLGNLVAGLVEKAVSSAMGVTLDRESVAFVNHSTQTLRNGPGFK